MNIWKTIAIISLVIIAIGAGVGMAFFHANQPVVAQATIAPTQPWPTVPATRTPTPAPTHTPTPGPTPTPTFTPTATATHTPTPTPTPTPRVSITDIRGLGRLETVEYVMQIAIDLESKPESVWKRIVGVFGTDKILLLASGEVVAGVDLSRLSSHDVTIRGNAITLKLPTPEIFHTRIDNQESRVYLREKGIFYPLDKNLESRARKQAEQGLTNWALQHNIIEKARQNARLEMERFLHSLGFDQVTIIFAASPR